MIHRHTKTRVRLAFFVSKDAETVARVLGLDLDTVKKVLLTSATTTKLYGAIVGA